MSNWLYEGELFDNPENLFGFVYIIEHIETGKKYIGKKQFFFKKYKRVKGKRKGYFVESDWRDYWGSSEFLKEEMESQGQQKYRKTIIKLCKTKAECSYWEAKMQFHYDVLIKPEEFYNEWIMCRVRRSHLIKNVDFWRK